MDHKQNLIEKALDGSLSAKEQKEYNSILANEAEFAAQVNRRAKVGALVQANSSDSFSAFFVDRVMKDIASGDLQQSPDSLVQSLLWTFKRVAFASAFVAVALLSFNTLSSEDTNQSLVEMAFDIPAISIDATQDDFGLIEP